MKKEELFEAIEGIDPALVVEAENARGKKSIWRSWMSVAAGVVLVVGASLGIWLLVGNRGFAGEAKAMALAQYPASISAGENLQEAIYSREYRDWNFARGEQASQQRKYQLELEDYYRKLLEQVLPEKDMNTVCSPLNVYFACAMLAEVTDGEARQQVLDLLGVSDMETLREMSSALWELNYADSPIVKSVLANSLWLDRNRAYNEKTLERLAKQYYASSFSGDMGSREMNEALRNWVDENTWGLLKDYTKQMQLNRDTVMGILSTIYFQALWTTEFGEAATQTETFHGTKGNTKVKMMKRDTLGSVYVGEGFTAIEMGLTDAGRMCFILPDEGVDVNSLPGDPKLLNWILNGSTAKNGVRSKWGKLHLSVPKFKVSQSKDIADDLKALGVKDVFDEEKADFSPLTKDKAFVTTVNHAATLEIDEKGVKGAAYTEIFLLGAGNIPPEDVYFTLDRPFMFVVQGIDASILFSGIVRNIK